MRISDWSSDVCSSDLLVPVTAGLEAHDGASESLAELCEGDHVSVLLLGRGRRVAWRVLRLRCALRKTSYRCIRHSSTHERGEYSQSPLALRGRSEERRVGKDVSVRVDLGGRRIIQKKKIDRS